MAMKAKAADERQVMDRYRARLTKAFAEAAGDSPEHAAVSAGVLLRILRASASALFPGRQKRKHVLPALGVMVTAACRVFRRGAK
jgi:hypothetical protein